MKAVAWNLTEQEEHDLFRALRFRYFKWDVQACGKCLILPESIILTREEHHQAVAISERFAAILTRLEEALLARPDLLAQLGIPKEVIPLLTHAQPMEMQLARYDLFLTPDHRWMVSEFNEDVPGGFNEAVGLPDLLGRERNGASFSSDLRQAVIDAFAPHDTVAFLYATGYSEDLQHMLIVQQWLEGAGHETLMASPAHLRTGWSGPRVFGRRINAAFRFYPGEWFAWLDNRKHWERALDRLPLMNPLRRLLRQSKRLYAYWRDASLLSAEDLRFLETHAPLSRPYESAQAHDEPRERWVLKHAFGRMGDTVIMGNLVSDKEWAEALAEADREPHGWLLQERFEVAPLNGNGCVHPPRPSGTPPGRGFSSDFPSSEQYLLSTHSSAQPPLSKPSAEHPPIFLPSSEGLEVGLERTPDPGDGNGRLYPTIGTYMVNHRFAGYYSRVDYKPFINHEAYHVPTLVENI